MGTGVECHGAHHDGHQQLEERMQDGYSLEVHTWMDVKDVVDTVRLHLDDMPKEAVGEQDNKDVEGEAAAAVDVVVDAEYAEYVEHDEEWRAPNDLRWTNGLRYYFLRD